MEENIITRSAVPPRIRAGTPFTWNAIDVNPFESDGWEICFQQIK